MTAADQAGIALAAVLAGLAAAAVSDLAGRRTPAHLLRLLACLASAVFALGAAGGPVDLVIGRWLEAEGAGLRLGLNLRGDGIAASAVTSSAALCLLYPLAQPAMDRVQRALGAAAAAGTVLLSCAADWLPLLLGWEIAAAALLLTAARSPAVSGAGARRLLLLTRAGSAALAAAAVTCLAGDPSHGGIDWAAPGARLLVFAAAVGLGLWPLHQWLLEASPCRAAGAAAGALMVAGAVLLSRVVPGLGPLQPLVFGVGLTTAVAGAAAALASRGILRIPAWIAVAHSGLTAAAMAAGPAAGWLLLAASLCARLCLSAGAGLAQAALPAAERLHELRGLAAHLPAARRLSMAGALIPVLSLSALWGHALLLGHARDEYGPLGPGVILAVLALAAFPVVRFALAPFGGRAPRPAAAEPARPALPATAGCLAAGLAFAALPALCWWRLTPPPPEGLALAAAAGAAALGVSVLVRRRGAAPDPGPASAVRRLAAGGFGAGAALRGLSAAGASLGRGLWTLVDGAFIGGAWGALDLVARASGWVLISAQDRRRPLGAAALAAGAALAVLWSMGGR